LNSDLKIRNPFHTLQKYKFQLKKMCFKQENEIQNGFCLIPFFKKFV
jgi:hypothetical protein